MRTLPSKNNEFLCNSAYCQAIAAPYLVLTGTASGLIRIYDVRAKDALIGEIVAHKGQIRALEMSVNRNVNKVRTSDLNEVFLATASEEDSSLGIWRLSDMLR